MSSQGGADGQREFRCEFCEGKILIPKDLPPTAGPCPHCKKTITSPSPEVEGDAADPIFGRPLEETKPTMAAPPPLPPDLVKQSAEAKAKAEEEKRLAEEKAKAEEEQRLAEEKAKAEEEQRLAEEKAKAEEEQRLAEEKAKAEEEQRLAEEKAKAEEEQRLAEEKAKAEEEQRLAEEKAKAEEEQRLAEEKAKAEEEQRLAEEKAKAEEEQRLAEEKARAEEEQRLAEESAKAEEEQRLAEEKTRAEEEQRLAEEKARAEEEQRLAEEKAKAEEEQRLAEEKAKAEEEQRLAEEKAEERRLAAERARAEEEKRLAEEWLKKEGGKRRDAAEVEAGVPDLEGGTPQEEEQVEELAATAASPEGEGPPDETRKLAAAAAMPSPKPEPAKVESPFPEKGEQDPFEDRGAEKPAVEKPRRSKAPLALAAMLCLLAGGIGFAVYKLRDGGGDSAVDPAQVARIREEQYLEKGWEKDASEVLDRFLKADTAAGKAAHSIRGSELLAEMDAFYGGGRIDDSDTPVGAFSVHPLPIEDRRRGIFMMVYDQPPAFEMSEFFSPIAPLDVQYGVRDPGILLASVSRVRNFTGEALKVWVFFRRTEEGLRVDWETFAQTKYRTLRDFLEIPDSGNTGTFRVFIKETVPDPGVKEAGTRTYQVSDPAHPMDRAKLTVPVDSDIGRALSILNWRGTKQGRSFQRNATVELGWSDDAVPRLVLSRFVCWEFLGVGGNASDGSS